MSNWYFFHQRKGGEEAWAMSLAGDRDKVINSTKPAFVTVLDLSSVPEDGDWSKTRYRGPLYFDFDAGDDLPFVCEQFQVFLSKLHVELDFDITQARLYASGGKGFHIEIPEECFLPKLPVGGTAWLPYVYREMAQSIIVDTLDLTVYTGKRGRMWRTSGVKRENGHYKIPISVDEAMSMDAGLYRELTKEARPDIACTPPSCGAKMAALFDRSKDKIITLMRTKKKRMEVANKFLDPWKKAKRTPPSITRLMNGEDIAEGAGFQQLSMQLAIYASSVAMDIEEYLDRCKGLCENHVSDSYRYNSPGKRREELARMFRYMADNTLYEFDPGPIVRLTKPGVSVSDLGVVEEDTETGKEATPEVNEDGDPVVNMHRSIRKGLVMNKDGLFKRGQETTDSLSRAYFDDIVAFYDLASREFRGYEFTLKAKGSRDSTHTLTSDVFVSSVAMKKFLALHQFTYQGGEPETTALMDIMAEKAAGKPGVYCYPREGLFVQDHPDIDKPTPVVMYLTRDTFISSIPPGAENYFKLAYRPSQAESAHKIDIHKAPQLGDEHKEFIGDLFRINKESVMADLLGWFVAAHYRSVYLYLFKQFPLLQAYGEAGAGKTKTIELLARLHWYKNEIAVNSCMSCTAFALDNLVSTSSSAPAILDEYKPRALVKKGGNALEKLRDTFKMSYTGSDVGNRGTVNKAAENSLSVIKSKVTAPIVFMGEAIEMETAIYERSVSVNLSKKFITGNRKILFTRLQRNTEAISALGRAIVEMGFRLDFAQVVSDMDEIRLSLEAGSADGTDRPAEAERMLFNRCVIIHGLRLLRSVLQETFGSEFDPVIASLLATKEGGPDSHEEEAMHMHGMSEISKVLKRIARLTFEIDAPYEVKLGQDYLVFDGYVELNVERSYDHYRRWCTIFHEVPLFDSMESFVQAFGVYSPCKDRNCVTSVLRNEWGSDRIVRLDSILLSREGVSTFRSAS
jgi:hypothetical protein